MTCDGGRDDDRDVVGGACDQGHDVGGGVGDLCAQDPCTCRRYYACIDARPVRQICPSGLYWDDIKSDSKPFFQAIVDIFFLLLFTS